MGAKYLIDTNIIIDFSEGKLSESAKLFAASIIDDDPYLSVINKIELLGFSRVATAIVEFVTSAHIIGLTDEIIHRTISIRKTHKIKLPDAIIAATALEHKLVLVTNNYRDFDNIKGLKIRDLVR